MLRGKNAHVDTWLLPTQPPEMVMTRCCVLDNTEGRNFLKLPASDLQVFQAHYAKGVQKTWLTVTKCLFNKCPHSLNPSNEASLH